jgi:hypothetical protein
MDATVKLIQVLVWPIFLAVFLWIARHQVRAVLATLKQKIDTASTVKIGSSGLEIGAQLAPDDTHRPPEPDKAPHTTTSKGAADIRGNVDSDAQLEPSIHVAHTAVRDPSLDRGSLEYYRLSIFLTASETDLRKVSRVVYHLHPSFPDPDRTVSTRSNDFALETAAWGQFNLTADVYLRNSETPLHLGRYLNFY